MKDKFKKVVKGFFGWFTGIFGGTFVEVGRSVKNLRQSPLPSGISLAIMLARIAAIVMFVFSYVVFVLDNGYGEQISIIGQGLVQWSQAFTLGTLSNYYGGFALIAWTIVLGLSFFAIHIVCIIKEGGVKRILMILLMLIVLAALVVYLLFVWGVFGDLSMPVISFDSLGENIRSLGLQGFAMPIYLGVLVFTLFAACVLAVRSSMKRQMKQWLSSVISVYIGLPLLLWFTQNLLALAAGIITLLILGGILYLLFSLLVSRIGDSSEGEKGESNAESAADPAADPAARKSGHSRKHDDMPAAPVAGHRVVEVGAGVKLWKIKSATGDYIQGDAGQGATGEVCTAADFDKGKVVIMQGGEQVGNIPWKPKK